MCGNFGLLAAAGVDEEDIVSVLREMAALTELRGALGGGIATIAWKYEHASEGEPTSVASKRVRVLQKKRQILTNELLKANAAARPRISHGPDSVVAYVGHTRYPTSSRSTVPELHPHLWTPHAVKLSGAADAPGLWYSPPSFGPNTEQMFRAECMALPGVTPGAPTIKGKEGSTLKTGIFLSHNGDFEEYDLFNQRVTCAAMGDWLSRVLHEPNSLSGDSPKIAGLIEFLNVKGNWLAAVRLAFQKHVAQNIQYAYNRDPACSPDAPNTSPSHEWYAAVGKLLEAEWEAALSANTRVVDVSAVVERLIASVTPDSRWRELFSLYVQGDIVETITSLIRFATERFVNADLFNAVSEFLTRAHGSFGIQVVSAVDPACLVVGSKGQAMHLSLDTSTCVAMSASEGKAVDVSIAMARARAADLQNLDGSRDTGYKIASPAGRFKLRLDSGHGQVVEVRTLKLRVGEKLPRAPEQGIATDCSVGWPGSFAMRSFDVQSQLDMHPDDLMAQIAPALAQPPPMPALLSSIGAGVEDVVLRDLRDIPNVMTTISRHWRGPDSATSATYNKRTATAFSKSLQRSVTAAENIRQNFLAPHLLVLGVEVSLFAAEQFAADVCGCVPGLRACALSANKFLGGDQVVFGSWESKSALSFEALAAACTTVLVVSHSGQTYPCLKATERLVNAVGESVFILVGGGEGIKDGDNGEYSDVVDAEHTEMGAVVMAYHKEMGTIGPDHIFCNLSGFRPAEPSSVALVASHHTLTELCIFLTKPPDGGGAKGISGGDEADPLPEVVQAHSATSLLPTTEEENARRESFRDDIIGLIGPSIRNLERIVGRDSSKVLRTEARQLDVSLKRRGSLSQGGYGEPPLPLKSIPGAHAALVRLGRHWGEHISEPWRVLFLSGSYIIISVWLQIPVWRTIMNLFVLAAGDGTGDCFLGLDIWSHGGDEEDCHALSRFVGILVSLLDGITYVMLPVYIARALRWFEGRTISHRFGKRTLVIADNPFVARCAEAFGTRLFALSYGFSVPEMHTADPCDDLIHRFGHRASRGMLVLAGRPDGRLFTLTRTEVAGIMGIKQLRFVENLGEGPEVISIGANPYHEQTLVHAHVALPQSKIRQNQAGRARSGTFDANRMTTNRLTTEDGTVFLQNSAVKKKGSVFMGRKGSALIPRRESTRSMPKKRSIFFSGSSKPPLVSLHSRQSLEVETKISSTKSALWLSEEAAEEGLRESRTSSAERGSFWGGVSASSNASDNPMEIEAFQSNHLDGVDISKFQRAQLFLESRVNSLERFVSAAVLLHAMAEGTQAGLWGLPKWSMSRSQAHLRVATTACPVTDQEGKMEEVVRSSVAY